jgi:hypothetical protein
MVPQVAAKWQLESFALVGSNQGASWGYLTSDESLEPTGFTKFAVIECLPFDKKQLLAAARQKDWDIQEIKKRGVRVTPAEIRSWFPRTNGDVVTLVITPTSQGVRAIFARRPYTSS